MNRRRREIEELIELIEELDIRASDIQQEREQAAEQLRIAREEEQRAQAAQQEREQAAEQLRVAREEEQRAQAAQARADRNANRGRQREPVTDIQVGDRVIILSRVVLPVGIAGTRPVNEDDRRGVVTSMSRTGRREIYVTTDSGNTTWRLPRHLAKEQ